jgi:hypothetical protein
MAQAELYSMPLNESRLIRAIQLNHSGIAAALLDQGADIDDRNSARGVGFPGRPNVDGQGQSGGEAGMLQ